MEILKKYPILSEDAYCNLSLLLNNIINGMTYQAYEILFKKLAPNKVLKLKLTEATQIHFLSLATAAKINDGKIIIDTGNQPLDLATVYRMWAAMQFEATFDTFGDQECISDIPLALLDSVLDELIDKIIKIAESNEIDIIVVPLETNVFYRHDFPSILIKKCLTKKFKLKLTAETLVDFQYDYTSWVQSIDMDINFSNFYWALTKAGNSGKVSTNHLESLFENKIQVGDSYNFDCYDDFCEKLFYELNIRFKNKLIEENVVEVTHSENLETFKTFLNVTHSLATGEYITPLTAVLTHKFKFQTKDKIMVVITDSLKTTFQQQDLTYYVDSYLYMSLVNSGEIIKFFVEFNTECHNDTVFIQQVMFDLGITIHHWRYLEKGVGVECYSPGYQQLVFLEEKVNAHFNYQAFKCKSMPRYANAQRPVQSAYYDTFDKTQAFLYQSHLQKPDDITVAGVDKALQRLEDMKAVDPCIILNSAVYSQQIKAQVTFVYENLQQTGSFKIRGASNMLLNAKQAAESLGKKICGVIACSAGNHAQGCAKTSQLLQIPCTIVCPETAPFTKLYNTMRYKAEVIKHGKVFDVANSYGQSLSADRGWLFVPPYNSFDIIEGQATIAASLLKKQPDIEYILVNVGGGGMISGIALYAKKFNPKIKIIGVQASKVFPLQDFNSTGELRRVDPAATTIADGCNVKFPGGVHNLVLKEHVDQYISVEENEIASTIINQLLLTKTVSEGAGCMGLSALLYDKIKLPGKKIAVVLCGGNIDIKRLQVIYKLGAVGLGRRLKIRVLINDTVGEQLKIMRIINRHAGLVDYMRFLRNVNGVDWDKVQLSLEVRFGCVRACIAMKDELKKLYPTIMFPAENVIPDIDFK